VIVALGSRESRWGQGLTPKGPGGTSDFVPRPFTRPHRPEPCRPTATASGAA
jgi:hypothetical protein